MQLLRISQCLVTLLASLGLASCQMAVSMYEGPDAGFAVASIAVAPDSTYENVQFDFRDRDRNTDSYLFRVNNADLVSPETDFHTAGAKGGVATIRLRPGQYEFYSFAVQNDDRGYTPRFAYSIPFTIEPGKVTYLGQFLTLGVLKDGVFGAAVLGEPYFVISNQQTRDLTLATKKTPELVGASVISAVPNPTTLRAPYFRATALPTKH
jgi:hypothetical protein